MEALTSGISPDERVAVFRAARLAAEADVKDERERQHLRRLHAAECPGIRARVAGIRAPRRFADGVRRSAEAPATGRTLYARCAKAVEGPARDLDARRLLQFVRSQ